jgi:cell division protein ZapA (FtsZ GTPase activity inhibitor)
MRALLRIYLSAIAAGFVTAAVVHGIDSYLARVKLPNDATILDDILLAVMVAVLVLLLELHHRRDRVREQRKMAVVREMNHHVRNALQTIVFATSSASNREVMER